MSTLTLIELTEGILHPPLQTPESVGCWQQLWGTWSKHASALSSITANRKTRGHVTTVTHTGAVWEALSVFIQGSTPSCDELTGRSMHTPLR